MSVRRIKRRPLKTVRHSYGCACHDPQCPNELIGRICEKIGCDIPQFPPSTMANGICQHHLVCDPEGFENYLMEHATSHAPEDVLAGREDLHLPFVLMYKSPSGDQALRLMSIRPGHEQAFCRPGHEYVPRRPN